MAATVEMVNGNPVPLWNGKPIKDDQGKFTNEFSEELFDRFWAMDDEAEFEAWANQWGKELGNEIGAYLLDCMWLVPSDPIGRAKFMADNGLTEEGLATTDNFANEGPQP